MKLISCAFACLNILGLASAADEDDRVMSLPNGTASIDMTSATYSGYLNVTETKSLHYIYVESMDSPSFDPLVIWFNGGPGCSSMLGFMQEHGPWIIDDGEDYIKPNPYSWNRRANMLYIESPAGVGFSIAGEETSDWTQNDMSQSEDAIIALKEWFVKFPERVENNLFVSGESYGGIYVPYLSWQIYQHNNDAALDTSLTAINLKGFMVGNGATDWDFDVSPSFPETVYNFNLISQSQLDTYQENYCVVYFNDFRPMNGSDIDLCTKTWGEITNMTGDLNWYDLYRPVYPGGPLSKNKMLKSDSDERYGVSEVSGEKYKRGYTFSEYTPWLKNHPAFRKSQAVFGSNVTDFLNNKDVREALNIPESVQNYEECSDKSGDNYHYQAEASLWIYQVLKRVGIKMMHYSGDTDGAVPTLGTKRWIKKLDWEVTTPWAPWIYESQVAGYKESYDGLDFVTIKGVGHMAPQWARGPVWDMITTWIHED